MAIQTIDFSNISDATFNNVGLTEIIYNGVKVWMLSTENIDINSFKVFKTLETNSPISTSNYQSNFSRSMSSGNGIVLIGEPGYDYEGGNVNTGIVGVYDTNGNFKRNIEHPNGITSPNLADYFGMNTGIVLDEYILIGDHTTVPGSSVYVFDMQGNYIKTIPGASHQRTLFDIHTTNKYVLMAYRDATGSNRQIDVYTHSLTYLKTISSAGDVRTNEGCIASNDSYVVISSYEYNNLNTSQSPAYIEIFDSELNLVSKKQLCISGIGETSVEIKGDRIYAGYSAGYPSNLSNEATGVAFILDLSGNIIKELVPNNRAVYSEFGGLAFGHRISVADNAIFISAPYSDLPEENLGQVGRVDMFTIDGDFVKSLHPDWSYSFNEQFGITMTYSDKTLFVGAPFSSNTGQNNGIVSIFKDI